MKKQNYLLSAALAMVPAVIGIGLMSSSELRRAEADVEPFRCSDASLYFPSNGIIGWTYGDPASTDRNASGSRTVHTGVDIFAEGGNGAPIQAPADGIVSRQPRSDNLNLILPGVTNTLNGEAGIEVYISHVSHSLSVGQEFKAGDIIAYQAGEHVHLSVGAFLGFDDREIGQTQDPSPYFNATLGYQALEGERQPAAFWCLPAPEGRSASPSPSPSPSPAPAALVATPTTQVIHIVESGDTLSGIAEHYGVTVEAIAEANALEDLDFLNLGQELIIPGASPVDAPEASSEAGTESEENSVSATNEYVVVQGDTLYGIAEKLGVDVEVLIELNDLEDVDFLSIGDVLLIP